MRREEICFEETRREQLRYAEILYRSVDAQLEDFQSALQRLSSALSPYFDNLPEPIANYIIAQIRDDLEHWRRTYGGKDYNPDQPRGPDGRWISDGSGDSPGKGEMNIDKAVAYLNARAKSKPPAPGKGKCATYVREAIEKGGSVTLVDHPVYAYQYALPREEGKLPYLDNYFDRITPTPKPDYSPQKGDIAVFQSPNAEHPEGHIQIYSGTQWVSDFKQPRRFWPGKDYEDIKPPYVIYRPKDWKPNPSLASTNAGRLKTRLHI